MYSVFFQMIKYFELLKSMQGRRPPRSSAPELARSGRLPLGRIGDLHESTREMDIVNETRNRMAMMALRWALAEIQVRLGRIWAVQHQILSSVFELQRKTGGKHALEISAKLRMALIRQSPFIPVSISLYEANKQTHHDQYLNQECPHGKMYRRDTDLVETRQRYLPVWRSMKQVLNLFNSNQQQWSFIDFGTEFDKFTRPRCHFLWRMTSFRNHWILHIAIWYRGWWWMQRLHQRSIRWVLRHIVF